MDLHCLKLIDPTRAGVQPKCGSPDNAWRESRASSIDEIEECCEVFIRDLFRGGVFHLCPFSPHGRGCSIHDPPTAIPGKGTEVL
jgi:hypothetical protein